MAYINDLDINITLETKGISVASFHLPLLLGSRPDKHALVDKYGLWGSIDEMKTAGFVDNDPEVKMAKMILAQNPKLKEFMVYIGNASKPLAEQLELAKNKNSDFYFVLATTRKKAEQHLIAEWVATQEKIFIGGSADKTVLENRNNIREVYLIHNEADKFFEAAWLGSVAVKDVGSYTWHYQTPNLVTPANFSLSELKEIRKNKGQSISKRKDVVYVDNGITTGGEFIDVIQVRDWIKTRLEESLFSLLIRKDKIPYDDRGILIVKSEMRKVFQVACEQGMIASVGTKKDLENSDEGKFQYKIFIPPFAQQTQNDRATRTLNRVHFSFVILGAIEKIKINGVIKA